jgi:hypothetical protein
MRATNIDWTGQFAKVGKAGARGRYKVKARAGWSASDESDDGYNRNAICTAHNGGFIILGAIAFGMFFVNVPLALVVTFFCARRMVITQ